MLGGVLVKLAVDQSAAQAMLNWQSSCSGLQQWPSRKTSHSGSATSVQVSLQSADLIDQRCPCWNLPLFAWALVGAEAAASLLGLESFEARIMRRDM